MKQRIVGIYTVGHDAVRLVLGTGTGAETDRRPRVIPYTQMVIGADRDEWGMILGSILHETQEYAMAQICCRYGQDDEFGQASDSYTFITDHVQFNDVCNRAGLFLAACEADLRKAWKAWKKARGKKK